MAKIMINGCEMYMCKQQLLTVSPHYSISRNRVSCFDFDVIFE